MNAHALERLRNASKNAGGYNVVVRTIDLDAILISHQKLGQIAGKALDQAGFIQDDEQMKETAKLGRELAEEAGPPWDR